MHLDHARLAELGLQRQPFPESATLEDPEQRARIDDILRLLRESTSTVLVTGPIGVGVSRLLLQIEAESDTSLRLLTIDGEDKPTPDDICHTCLEAFDLPPAPVTSGPKLLDYVADWLDSLAQASDRPALLVDNAHHLGEQTLDALLSMQEGEEDDYIGPALLLAGAPDLEDRVARLGELLDEDHFHVFRLEPWTEEQVAAYIARGLEQAGGTQSAAAELLDPEDIHLRSGGYPAQVRAACLQALSEPAQPQNGLIDRLPLPSVTPLANIPQNLRSRQGAVILITAVLFVIVVLFTLLRPGGQDTDLPEQELVLQPRPVPAQPSAAPPPEYPGTRQTPASSAQTGAIAERGEMPDPAGELPTVASPSGDEEPVAPMQEPAPVQPEEDEGLELVERPALQPEEPRQEETPPDPRPAPAETVTAAPETDSLGATNLDHGLARQGVEWLAERPAGHYTIQIVAATNPDTLEAFVRDQSNVTSLRIVPTRRDGELWYVVVAGDYPDRDTARQGLDALPAEQREHGAWVRSFASLNAVGD